MILVKRCLLILSVSVLIACADKPESEYSGGFSLVCDYFQALQELKNISEMDYVQRNDFIVGKVTHNIPDSDATASWLAVSSAASEDRYEIFKMGAEEALETEWECNAMKILAPTTGAVE